MDAALGLLGLGTPCEIEIELHGGSNRRYIPQGGASSSSTTSGHNNNNNGEAHDDDDTDEGYDYGIDTNTENDDGGDDDGGDDDDGEIDRGGFGGGGGGGYRRGGKGRKSKMFVVRGGGGRGRSRRKRVNDGSLLPLYTGDETVSGEVYIAVKGGKQVHHRGIKIEFVGSIDMLYDREHSQEFTTLERILEDPGILTTNSTSSGSSSSGNNTDNNNSNKSQFGKRKSQHNRYAFEFTNVEKAYDTYHGINVRLRYFLRVTIIRGQYTPDILKQVDIGVQHITSEPSSNLPIRMEVGIEDALHIEFEYNKSKFHLDDVVIGKIYFLLVRIHIKRMEVEIRKRESAGSGANVYNETDTVMRFEVMDGPPTPGQTIPVRMFLNACKQLTPTYRSVNNKFSVKYYLNLVLVDRDDRRYFKQSEITIWRAA